MVNRQNVWARISWRALELEHKAPPLAITQREWSPITDFPLWFRRQVKISFIESAFALTFASGGSD